MEACVERSMRDLVPLKSSSSVMMGDARVWSNTACTSGLNGEDFIKLDTFAQRLVERRLAKQELACEREKRTKKSRQVFTWSQPDWGILTDFTANDAEVFESVGTREVFGHLKPHWSLNVAEQVSKQDEQNSPLSEGRALRVHESSQHQAGATQSEISFPTFILPTDVNSEHGLKACIPYLEKPNLLYSVSDSSLPMLKNSTLLLSKVSSVAQAVEAKDKSYAPAYGTDSFSNDWFHESKSQRVYDFRQRHSIVVNCHKDESVEYTRASEDLARKIGSIQRVKPVRVQRKFMDYVKFNPSYKLSEVIYEDVNSRSVSHVPSLTKPFQLSGLIHKVNPDYDDDQSITEAMTAIKSLSSITSLNGFTRVCRFVSKRDTKTRNGVNYGWIESKFSSCKTNSQIVASAELSDISANTERFSCVKSPVRKIQVFSLRHLLRKTFLENPKETDNWSSASTSRKVLAPLPKRLVDIISSSCIFHASVVDKIKRPVWQLKSDDKALQDRMSLTSDFIFKAHYYMRMRDRPNFPKFFFRPQPSYRVVDQSVQFPDVKLVWDRNLSVNRSQSGNGDGNQDQSRPPDAIAQESGILPNASPVTETGTNLRAANSPEAMNSNSVAICLCHLGLGSTLSTVPSEPLGKSCAVPPTVANTVTSTHPASTSSNKFQSLDDLPSSTLMTGSNQQTITDKLQPVLEDSGKCRKVSQSSSKKSDKFCRSYPAFCDKRKIKVKYENGKYTVLKEKDAKRQTIWSILKAKATHLLKSVAPRRRHRRRR